VALVQHELEEVVTDEELVQKYAALVKRIAFHLISRLPPTVQIEDLLQAGMMGLLDAAHHYNAEKGASFATYATIRIRGSMLDELRSNDWAPRSVHRNTRRIAEAAHHIENTTGRDARDFEVASALGISLDVYHTMMCDTNNCQLIALEELNNGQSSYENILESSTLNPLEDLQYKDFCEKLSRAIDALPPRERVVLVLYYQDNLNLKQIGEVLEVSESRVCQIHSQAMSKLRSKINLER